MWKILERKVPSFSPPIQCHISDRRGRLCSSGIVPTGHLGTLCHNSFRIRAATLFNCLPKHIRNIVNCANPIMFKRALDNHLFVCLFGVKSLDKARQLLLRNYHRYLG